MSEQKIASVVGGTGKSTKSVQSFQPVWMAHWMQPGSIAAENRHGHGDEEFNCVTRGNNMKNGSKFSRPVRESGVIETRNFEIASSKGDENETACWSLIKHGDKNSLKGVLGNNVKRDEAIDCKGGAQFSFAIPAINEASFGRCNSAGEGTSKSLPKWMKTHSSAIDRSIATLKSSHGPMAESSKHIFPYYDLKKCEFDKVQKEFDKGKAPLIMKSPVASMDQFTNSTMRMLDQEHCYKHGQLADLVCERQIDSHLDTTMDVRLRDLNTSLLFDTPSESHHHLPTLAGAWFQKMQNHSSSEAFPRRGTISDKAKSNKPCCNCYSLQKLPYCVDMQTMRICATVDSVEATPEGFPMFSQTKHSMLITKDVDSSKENDGFRTAELVAEMNRNPSSDIHSISPFYGQVKRGVELQSLSSSSNSKGKRNIEYVTTSKVGIKNESSAETDTLDEDLFKEGNSNPGDANHTPSIKSIDIGSTLSPHIDATSYGDARHHWMKAIPPDCNQGLPALAAAASSSENMCPTISRTQSLDIDTDKLLRHSEHPNKNSYICPGGSSEADPTMRWVKRLKVRSPNSSSQGSRSLNLGENSSPDEMRKFLKKILERDIANSEPPPRSHHVDEIIMPCKSQGLTKANEILADSAKKGKESLLSQTWIKRWLQKGSKVTKKKPPLAVVCEPQSFKSTPDDFQKKPFPSIAAMALMGKAMSGLQSCELQKQDSFTIWNTNAF